MEEKNKTHKAVKLSQAAPPVAVDSLNLRIFTQWTEWTKCTRCGVRGRTLETWTMHSQGRSNVLFKDLLA